MPRFRSTGTRPVGADLLSEYVRVPEAGAQKGANV
jgi:hypothetical protein